MRGWKIRMLAPAAAVFCVAMMGCSQRADEGEIVVTMWKLYFEPTEWTVPAGSEVTITLINNGDFAHEWALMDRAYVPGTPFEEDLVLWRGFARYTTEAHTYRFTAPAEPGRYPVLCGIASHLDEAEAGTLIVTK
jgi:plastocyanin